jgi:hypothetical protein
LATLLADLPTARELGARGREAVRRDYSMTSLAQRLLDITQQVSTPALAARVGAR